MKNVTRIVHKFLAERDWLRLPPSDLAKSVSIEAAELLEHFQWGNPSIETVLEDGNLLASIEDEVADVMIYALEMCVILNIDPQKIIENKIRCAEKKYPADAMKIGRGDRYSGPTNEKYYEIKAKSRE